MKKQSAVWIAAAVLGTLCGVALSLKPWQKMQDQRETRLEAEQSLRTREQEHAELARREAQVRTEVGQEANARERGFKRPEEKPWEAPTR